MPELYTLTIAGLVFLIAGTVKGIIGMGLPSISLALLTVAIDLPGAMVLMLIPSFTTNLWQALSGGHATTLAVRLWPFFLAATATIWIGALAFSQIAAHTLSGLLGLLLAIYATINLLGYRITLNTHQQRWGAPLLGAVNGILTGMTGSFVVPGVLYLQAIGLSKDMLVQAMGILFTLSTIALAIALHGNQLLEKSLVTLSLISVLPAMIGMTIGQRLRRKLSEQHFRLVFFWSLLLLAIYILLTASQN